MNFDSSTSDLKIVPVLSTEINNRLVGPDEILRVIDTGALYVAGPGGKPQAMMTATTTSDGGVAVIENYALLRSNTNASATKAIVIGRATATDGAGGTFTVDKTDTTTADNDGTVLVDTLGRRWKRFFQGGVRLEWFGAIADYTGTPLYDGADGSRVTGTDNTAALYNCVNAAISSGCNVVLLPPGHFGIKTGNLLFSNFGTLRICGSGIDATVIDYIKEDATGSSYVDETVANCIAKFSTGDSLEFSDLTIKATTKAGLVTGAPGSNDVYRGKVWGLKLENIKSIALNRVRVDYFNYRGISVYGSLTERIKLTDCSGNYNAGSGFWIQDAAALHVFGGTFSYNGIFGETGTGYGVTASAKVGKVIVTGARFFNNYRKGLDSHGCTEFNVKGCSFYNNVLYHMANINWGPPVGSTDCVAVVMGNTFSNGKSPTERAWLKSCYDKLATNGYVNDKTATHAAIAVHDTDSNGTPASRVTSVSIVGNVMLSNYNGIGDTALTSNPSFISVIANSARLTFSGNKLDFSNASMYAGGDVYSHTAIRLLGDDVTAAENDIYFPQATVYTNSVSTLTDYGTLFELKSGCKLSLLNNKFDVNDVYFMTTTGGGVRHPVTWTSASSSRVAKGNVFKWSSDPFRGVTGLNDAYFMGTDSASNVPLQLDNNVFIRNGVKYKMPDEGIGITSSQVVYKLEGVSKAQGADVFYIVLDKQYACSIRISTKDASPDLFITIPYSSYGSNTASTGNSLLEYSACDANFVENGITKLKITIRAKVALSGDYWGRITVDGLRPGLGIEKFVKL